MAPPRAPWKRMILPASVLSLFLVSYVDYVTGYEILFFVFYFVPVALCGWYLGWWSTLGMALLSGISWFFVDRLSEHVYPHEGMRYWNAFICTVAFAIIGVALRWLRHALDEQRRAREELRKALDDLKNSTEEIRKLQSDFQVVCAWTKQVRVDGQWMPFDKFLAEKMHLSVSHGISPEALERLKNELGGTP